MIKYKLLADFQAPGAIGSWTVNGGASSERSRSNFAMTPNGTAVFEGAAKEERKGWMSVSTGIGDLFLDIFRGVALRVKGDGKRYRFCLDTEVSPEDIIYAADFETQQDVWSTIYLEFSKFGSFSRNSMNAVPAPPLDPVYVRGLEVMTGEGQPGDFSLEIEWIKAYLDY